MSVTSRFDWDPGNRDKCLKHGVSIEEIEELFRSGPRVAPDPAHSDEEDRLLAIGRTAAGRALFVVFTLRMVGGEQMVRPVSARYMHSKEAAKYEQESPPAKI